MLLYKCMKQKTLYIQTYGCQMNVYDSLKIKNLLRLHGYILIPDKQNADLIILNTCHIREKSSEKVYSDNEHRSKLSNQILENYAESLNNYLPNILLRFRFKRLYDLKQKFVQILGSIPLMNEIIHQIKDKKILAQFKSTNSENPELLEELSNLKNFLKS